MGRTDAERRQLTVMFVDLVESTALSASLDPEELRELLLDVQDATVAAIERFHGHVAQYLGDGLLVYFGWPHAHDDDARRAVHAALAVLDATRTANERARRERRPEVDLRVGIHTGPVVVGDIGRGSHQESLALGETPNVAARLQELAEPGSIVVSAATAHLLEERFFVESLGERTLKGLREPMQLYRVTGETWVRSRFDIASRAPLLPLIGRDTELARLVTLWDAARAGHGRVALVSGEAGIGKSRLVQALKQHVSAQAHRWGSLRCSPYYSSTPLYPAIELWRQSMELAGALEPAARLAWLEEDLRHHGFDLSQAIPLFADLLSIPVPEERYVPLSMSPESRREASIEGVLKITLGFAARQPFLLVVEDLHWVDPTTADMLRRLAVRAADHALLAVYTSRPRIEHDCGRGHIVSLELGRLSDAAVDAMLAELAGPRVLPADVVRTLRERADGVPAFVEELGRFVLETPADASAPRSSAGIPASLRDSLTARLDRTGDAKELAQLAATIGRWFSHRLIAAVAGRPEESLEEHLARLVAARVLTREGDGSEVIYSFRHALMQELAYDSLLKRTRVRHHADIARAIETRLPELAEQHPELLAHHHARGGEPFAAVALFLRAACAAAARSAVAEARAHLQEARQLLNAQPDSAQRMDANRALTEAEEALTRARTAV